MENTLTNRQIVNLVLNRKHSFAITSEIDDTYGYSEYIYVPAQNYPDWLIYKYPASNWTYCPCCGNAAGQCGLECDCDQHNENCFEKISNSDLVKLLRKERNNCTSCYQDDNKIVFCTNK